jgi:hypothetical protein
MMGTSLIKNFIKVTIIGWPCNTNEQKKTAKGALELKLKGEISIGEARIERFLQVLKHVHRARVAQSVQRLATSWTTEGSEFESR